MPSTPEYTLRNSDFGMRFVSGGNTESEDNLIKRISLLIFSMNISEYESFPYLDYDYNDTCDQDGGPELPNGTTILHMMYYMLFFLSVLGNTTIFWVLIRYIKLKSMTDVCLLNLALSDLILAASLPLLVNYQNLATCKLLTGVYQVGFYSGNLFVTLMSVDRYFGYCPCCCNHASPHTSLWNHSQHHYLDHFSHHGNPWVEICRLGDRSRRQQLSVPAILPT
ncbi:hypothetical protein KUCAC02_013587 [Chaenocephalus aceratus]|uniref:Uncharacterized protein n=1 Tax=Chaenocephalus aceratus TaxID=36190 RepID=A0ACB9WBX2_CHAAC|nr:hypothetical protein KUCAC02_013587 [Chaenocephalus aceratus]